MHDSQSLKIFQSIYCVPAEEHLEALYYLVDSLKAH